MRSKNQIFKDGLFGLFAYNQLQLPTVAVLQTVTEEKFATTINTTCLIHWKHAFLAFFVK